MRNIVQHMWLFLQNHPFFVGDHKMCFCKRLLYSLSYHRHHPEEINRALWCNHVVGCEHFQPAPPPPRKSLPLNLKAASKQTLAASEQILRFLNFAKKHSTTDQSCDGDPPPSTAHC